MNVNPDKKLLIIGAGAYQHDIYTTARALGLQIFSVDANPAAPLFAQSDGHQVIDIYDAEAIAAYARENGIDGVATLNLDQGMNAVVAIQRALNRPAKDPDAVRAATRKDLMRAIWKEHGISQPAFDIFDNADDALDWITRAAEPIIIKPVDNAAKRGIAKITPTTPEIPALVARAFAASKVGKIIAEAWIEGTLCFAPTYLRQHNQPPSVSLMKQQITDRLVQVRYDAPFSFGPAIDRVVMDEALRAARCFGDGPYHTEVIVTPEGKPYLVETSPRVSYATVALSRLVECFDPVRELIADALGDDIPALCDGPPVKAARMQHLQPPAGSIYAQSGLPASLPPGIHEVIPVVPDGHVVQPFVTNEQRVMYFVATGETGQELQARSNSFETELTRRCFTKRMPTE